MTLASLAWLWLALAVVCMLVGIALTGKRVTTPPLAKRAVRLNVEAYEKSGKRDRAVCVRCAQPLEFDARYCGACGSPLGRERRAKRTNGLKKQIM